MIPMPTNPKIVVLANNGSVIRERNNLGNDLEVVVTHSHEEFQKAAAGIPYVAGTEAINESTRQSLTAK